MQHTMQYSVGGEIYNIPADKNEEFLKAAGDRAEPASRYRVGKDVYTIPQSQDADFKATLEQSGMAADPVRSVTMADGSRRDFTMPEMSRFLRSKEYRDSADFTAPEQGSPSLEAIKGFGGEMVGQLGGSAQTIRDTAESANPVYKGYAYAQDLANSLVGGLLAGSAKIEQGVGNLIGNEAVVNDALAGQRMVQNTMPTDMLDTTGGGIVNRVLQTGKGVASVTGEFAPAAIPGVGAAYGAAVISGGAVNRGVEVYDNAIANGMTPFQAASLANGAASVDAVQNLLLMGKFRGIWGGAEKSAAEGVKRGLVAKLTGVAKDAVRTGAIMGAGAATQNIIDQTAQNTDEVDWKKTADAGFDGFIEGGMFHLLNAGAHYAANPVSWVRESKTAPSGYVRDALDTAEGRALLFANNPEAAKEIYLARRDGKDVSRAMLKKANIPEDVAKDVANRNAIGDALVEDYNAYRGWVNNTELKYEVGKQRAAEERVAAEKQQAEVGWKRMEEREGREAENERARIEEADARATEEAHAARRDELTQAFADWSEAEGAVDSAVKAQKSGKPSGIKAAQAALEEAKTRAQERIAKMDDNALLDEIDAMSAVENPDAKVARQLGAMREEAIKRGIVGKDNASTIATENEKVSQRETGKRTSAKEFEDATNEMIDASTMAYDNEGAKAREKAKDRMLAAVGNGSDRYLKELYDRYRELIDSADSKTIDKIGASGVVGKGHDSIYAMLENELGKRGLLGDDYKQRHSSSAPKPDGKGRMVKAETPVSSQSANASSFGRRRVDNVVFDKPFVGNTGAKLVAYSWKNKKIETVDKFGDDAVKKISDWEESLKNENTNRDIVHHFTVVDADGKSHVVSAETAAKMLGVDVGNVRGEALKLVRRQMNLSGVTDAQKKAISTLAIKEKDMVSIMPDGSVRIVGHRSKKDGNYDADRWPYEVRTISTDGKVDVNYFSTKPKDKRFVTSKDEILSVSSNAPKTPPAEPAPKKAEPTAPVAAKSADAHSYKRSTAGIVFDYDKGKREAESIFSKEEIDNISSMSDKEFLEFSIENGGPNKKVSNNDISNYILYLRKLKNGDKTIRELEERLNLAKETLENEERRVSKFYSKNGQQFKLQTKKSREAVKDAESLIEEYKSAMENSGNTAKAPEVTKIDGETVVTAPDSIEAKIAAMPYGKERRQAQFDYMDAEVKKAKAAIEGKFKQHSDESGWKRADDSEIAPKVTIKVPADGEFTVLNNPDGIAKLEKIAAKLKSQIAEPQRMIPKFKRTPDRFAGYSVEPNGWEVDKPETMPKPPSLTVKSQGKSVSEADAVKIAKPFASTDKLRKEIHKVHVEDGKVVATDGRRIIVIDAPGAKAKGNDGEYVNWRSVIPKGEPAHEVKFPTAELYTKLVQAKVVADAAVSEGAYHSPIIELYDVDGKIGVIAKSDGASYSTHEEMPDSARLIGKFNVDFLIDAVEAAAKFGEKECNIGYNDDYSPMVQSGRNYKQVIMPLRIGDATATVADAVEEAPEAPLGSPAPSGTGRLSQREVASEGVGTGVRPWYKRVNHALTSPNAIINEARKLFPEFAFRERGTARMPNALGHWEPQRSLIRSQDISSVKVISHEIGHGIDQWTKKNPAVVRSPEVKRELLKLGRDLYGNQKPNGGYEAEGFAEYMMGYITGQDTAKVAPAVDRWFRETYARHNPKWMERIDKLRRMVDDLRMQTPQEEVRAFQRPALSLMDRAWSKIKRVFSEEMWSDDIAPLRRGFEKAGVAKELYEWQNDYKKLSDLVKEGNGSTKEADDLRASIKQKIETSPYLFASNVRGTQSQRAMDMARFGTTNLMGTELIGNVVIENGKVKMKNGKAVRDNNSESLRDIFRGWSDEAIADWQDYAIAKAGLENYLANGKEFGLQRRTLEAVVNHLETPEFEDALKRYSDYAHRILSNGVEAGYFDWDTYANIVNKNPHYVRITRRMADEFNANVTEGSGGQPVYRRKGGTQNVLPPIDALMMDVDRMMGRFFAIATQKRIIEGVMKGEKLTSFRKGEAKAIAANLPVRVNNEQEGVKFTSEKIRKEFVERAQRALIDTGKIPADLEGLVTNYKGKAMTVEEAAAQELYDNMFGEDGAQLTIFRERPANGKGGRISAYVNGKLETFEVPDEKWIGLLDGIETRSELSKLEKIANIATAGVRLGATTINPEFALRNGIRDSLHAAIMSETGAVPLVSAAAGMVEQVLGTDVQRLFTAMGGTMSDLIGMTKEAKWKNAGKVAVSGSDADNAAIRSAADKLLEIKNEIQSNVVKGSVKAVADVLQVPEMGPRLREFKGVLAKLAKVGIEGDAAKMLALAHGKDISIDFQRAGKAMRSINRLIPFSNACVRGTEQFMRNLGAFDNLPHQFETSRGKRAVKTLAKGALELTATCGSFALYQMMRMSEEERQKEFERPSTEKWEYINIAGYRIPLPFEAGLLFAGLPKALIYEAYGDKGAVADWAKTTAKALPLRYANVGDAIMSIAAIDPFVEIAINRNWQGKPIVNDLTKRNKERKDWYDFSTTTPAKVLGAFTDRLFGKGNAIPPAYIDHFLNAYTGGAWKRVLSPNQSILRNPLQTFGERKGNSRIVSEFYDGINQFAQSYGSKNISADDYGRYRAGEALKENISADFEEARKLIDADITPKEREKRRVEIMERIQDKIRNHNKRTDFRQLGIAHAVANLTATKVENVEPDVRDKSMAVLKGVSLDEARMALREYARAHKWSGETMMKRVSRLKKHFR